MILVMPWLAPEHQVAGSRAVLDHLLSHLQSAHTCFGIDPKDGFVPVNSWLQKGVFLHLSLHFGCFEHLKNQIGKLCILQLSYNYHFIISSRLDISQVIFFYYHVCPSLAFGSQRQLGGENRRKIHKSAISIHFFIVISFFDVF